MTQAEAAVLKQELHDLVDKELPALIAAEEARLPVAYSALVSAVTSAILPSLITMIDAKIDAIG